VAVSFTSAGSIATPSRITRSAATSSAIACSSSAFSSMYSASLRLKSFFPLRLLWIQLARAKTGEKTANMM